MTETGIHPGQEGEHRAWFHAAVPRGLPEQVTTVLEKNPDFAVTDSTQWERHVVHRLELEQDQANKQNKDLEDAQAQLLKLQPNEARGKPNSKKREVKDSNKTMMAARPQPDSVSDWPDLDPNLYTTTHLGRDEPWEIVGPAVRREGVVDTLEGENQELVVRGIPELTHGMSVTDVGLGHSQIQP